MNKKIIKFPSPMLKKKAKVVKRLTPEIVRLIDEMIKIMLAAPGIGLAAPQIGVLLRVIVADTGEGRWAIINPKLTEKHGAQTFVEGCLSLPGIEAPVDRASQVIVSGMDRRGEKIKIEAKGLLATVFQHEIDHLDGKVFIDRVKDPSLIKYVAFEREKREELI